MQKLSRLTRIAAASATTLALITGARTTHAAEAPTASSASATQTALPSQGKLDLMDISPRDENAMLGGVVAVAPGAKVESYFAERQCTQRNCHTYAEFKLNDGGMIGMDINAPLKDASASNSELSVRRNDAHGVAWSAVKMPGETSWNTNSRDGGKLDPSFTGKVSSLAATTFNVLQPLNIKTPSASLATQFPARQATVTPANKGFSPS